MGEVKPDLVIIHPGASHGIYGVLGDELVAIEPPVWSRILASYVRKRGYTVKIIDAEAEGLTPEQAAVRAGTPRLVCIAVYGHQPSASTQQMHAARLTAMAIKSQDIHQAVIMVGGHVAALTERTMREEAIDFACNGEGPSTIVELLLFLAGSNPSRAPSLDAIPGLAWRHHVGGETQVIVNPPASLLDINDLDGDAWYLLPMARYRAHNWQCFGNLDQRQPYASIFTSLGCPYKCAFCCINAPFDSNMYRMRDPKAVVDEIEKLYAIYGVRTFKIVDEMFVLNERHYTAIAEGLVDRDLGQHINIWAYSRVDTVKPGKLALLRRAGIRWLALGIESASAYVRDGARKDFKRTDITQVVREIQAAGINVIGNYIFGLPDDTEDTMRQTLEMARELNTEFANFYSAMAYPGSALYAEAVQKGWTLPATWRGYSQHNDDCRPLDTEHVPAKTVLAFRDHAFNDYFTQQQYLDMVRMKFGYDTLNHVRAMTNYKLDRKLLRGEIA